MRRAACCSSSASRCFMTGVSASRACSIHLHGGCISVLRLNSDYWVGLGCMDHRQPMMLMVKAGGGEGTCSGPASTPQCVYRFAGQRPVSHAALLPSAQQGSHTHGTTLCTNSRLLLADGGYHRCTPQLEVVPDDCFKLLRGMLEEINHGIAHSRYAPLLNT